jgi:predicted dehydrogenase
MIRVGVIGYGYWGPNLARNFAEVSGSTVSMVCDQREERLAIARSRLPSARLTTDATEVIGDTATDAVAIATPVSTHYDLARQALRAGKHVLVEKPIAASSQQGARLIDEAARRRLVLMVDHTFVYSAAVRKCKEIVGSGRIGEVLYFDSSRINLGLFQHDVNVIWDLAVHDLAILDNVVGQYPVSVSATGASHMKGQPENIAFLTLNFDSPLIAHLNVNWLAPVKIRQTIIGGRKKMLVYDDLDAAEPVKVYDKGLVVNSKREAVYRMLYSYRWGDMHAPRVDPVEPLRTEASHFVECIETGGRPLTDGEMGLRVVRVLEAASESLSRAGLPVKV